MNDTDYIKIQRRVIRDMNEGVIVLGNNGRILLVNEKALEILGITREEAEGRHFARVIFEDERNDDFSQTILEAVYKKEKNYNRVVPYYAGGQQRYMNVNTSELREKGKSTGVIIVLSDITELMEVRQHLEMLREIETLNTRLEEKNAFIRNAFKRYLSDEIVEKILDTPDGLKVGGSLERITVLMSDLRGFTALCEQVAPDALMEMLNHYFGHMSKIIKKHQGTVMEYMGDGILAVFGAPVKTENHAAEAVAAALEMQQAMTEVNRWNQEHGYAEFKMGIGVNTGMAVVGNMGSEYAMKYNAVGNCMNLCSRIESYTVDGQVFISSYTKEEIPCELDIQDQLEITPKGVRDSLTVFSVQGIGAPYEVHLSTGEEIWEKAEPPRAVQLFLIEGKHIVREAEKAWITAFSEKQLELMTETELLLYQNLVLRGERELYCKVIGRTEQGYLLFITGSN